MALPHIHAGQVFSLGPLDEFPPGLVSHALIKTSGFEVMRLVLRKGQRLPEHKVTGRLILHVLDGEVRVDLATGERLMRAFDWMHLEPDEPHALEALRPSSVIATLVFERPGSVLAGAR